MPTIKSNNPRAFPKISRILLLQPRQVSYYPSESSRHHDDAVWFHSGDVVFCGGGREVVVEIMKRVYRGGRWALGILIPLLRDTESTRSMNTHVNFRPVKI